MERSGRHHLNQVNITSNGANGNCVSPDNMQRELSNTSVIFLHLRNFKPNHKEIPDKLQLGTFYQILGL